MPELRPKPNNAVEYLRNIQKSGEQSAVLRTQGYDDYFLEEEELFRKYPDIEDKFIDSGSECIVLAQTDEKPPKKVVTFTYNIKKEAGPKGAKITFYLQRMFAILFPHNFPHFYASFGADKEKNLTSVSIKEFIEKDVNEDGKIFPFKNVSDFASSLNMEGIFDYVSSNFINAPDGGQYYVDKISLENNIINEATIEAVLNFMKKNNYSQEDMRKVKVCLERIIKLNQ